MEVGVQCPSCKERRAQAQYYRLNELSEEIEHLCRPCWLTLRKSERDEWRYFRGVGRFFLLYTVLPLVSIALVIWLLVTWIL